VTRTKLAFSFGLGGDFMYQHILVPVQNDLCSQVAAKNAFDLSRLLGSRVTLLHVRCAGIEDALLEQVQPWLSELAGNARVKPYVRIIASDTKSVANTILEVAQTENVDLIVMGTHGREGAERLRLGSVAQAVAGSSSIPVQIVPLRLQMTHGFVSKWKEALRTP
jgi:nucleotide-binding universal stress UspA family protein